MTQQRKMMLEELQRRNYSQRTAEVYLRVMMEFAKHFHRAPDQLTQEHIREYQAHLFRERNLSSSTVRQHVSALRFFYVKIGSMPRSPSVDRNMCCTIWPATRIESRSPITG